VTYVAICVTLVNVIKSFRSKPLADFWANGWSARIDARLGKRIERRLEALDAASIPQEMNVAGYDFHALRGFRPTRYSVHVNGPWCITFEFQDGDAYRVDLEQYH
jgi:proteic killer suppression protein